MPTTAGVQLKLSLFGDTEIAGDLLNTVKRVNDAAPWFRMMHTWLEGEVEKQFTSEGSHWSGGWKELSPTYAAAKAVQFPGQPILQASGGLFKSLTQRGGEAIRHTGRLEMVFGSTVPYGKYHQSKEPRDKLPRRPMLDLHDRATRRRMVRSLGIYVARDEIRKPTSMSGA